MKEESLPSKYSELQVLIIGDSKTMSKVLQEFLTGFGVLEEHIHFCNDGPEALALIETVRIDLILTSLWIPPPFNGLELLEKIRDHSKESIRKTPYIMLVGKDHPSYRDRANDLNISGYMTKPFKAEALRWLVDRVFQNVISNPDSELPQSGRRVDPVRKEESSSGLTGMKVMLVDDSSTNLTILKSTLSEDGLEFLEANSAEQALVKISTDLPDLIVLDVMMSGMTGFQVCKILKNEKRTKNIPVIFLTALDKQQSVLDGFNAGGVDFISKPFVPEEIRLRIRTQLSLVQAMKEKESLIQELTEIKKQKEELIDDLILMKEDLEIQAITDPLTGLSNRRGMWKVIEELKNKLEKGGESFSVVLSDIDFFKKVNDTLGHEAGDLVLQEVAGRLKEVVGERGQMARWGGEEFFTLIPDTDLEDAEGIAEEMRRAVEIKPVSYKGKDLNISMSFGVACLDCPSIKLEQLLHFADSAMYQAKKEGRNRVVSSASKISS